MPARYLTNLHRSILAGGTILALAVAVSGCGAGDVVDANKTQLALRFDVHEKTGVKVESVDCPSDVKVLPGTAFQCRVTAKSGLEAVATVEILNEDADLKVISLEKP